MQSTFGHHLYQITKAELVAQVPAHAQDDHLAVEVPPSKQIFDAVQFDRRWSSTLQRPLYPNRRDHFHQIPPIQVRAQRLVPLVPALLWVCPIDWLRSASHGLPFGPAPKRFQLVGPSDRNLYGHPSRSRHRKQSRLH